MSFLKGSEICFVKIDNVKGRLVPSQVRWRIVLPLPSLFEGINFTYAMIITVHTFLYKSPVRLYCTQLFQWVIVMILKDRWNWLPSLCMSVVRVTYFSLRIIEEKVKMLYIV